MLHIREYKVLDIDVKTIILGGKMKTKDAIEYFGSQRKLQEALRLKARQTIHAWGEFPPPGRQYQIEILTNGDLRAERAAESVVP